MKRAFLSGVLCVVALVFLVAQGTSPKFFPDIILTLKDGSWIDTRVYSDISDAIDGIGSSICTLHVVREETLNNDKTIPATVELKFLGSGKITQTAGTLTVSASRIVAPERVVFSDSGAGSFDFRDGMEVHSSWFDDFDDAVTATNDDTVTLSVDGYEIMTASGALGSEVVLKFEDMGDFLYLNSGVLLSGVSDVQAGDWVVLLGAGRADFADGVDLRTAWFERFDEAIRYIDDSDVTLVVNKAESLVANTTVHDGVLLQWLPGSAITVSATLTINGWVEAGPYQIFDYSGGEVVAFGGGNVAAAYPQWWGDGGANWDDQFTYALAAASKIAVPGHGKTYNFTSKVSLPDADREIIGEGWPVLNCNGADAVFEQANNKVLTVFDGLSFTGDGYGISYNMASTTASPIHEYRITNCKFAMDSTVYGIYLYRCQGGVVERCYFYGPGNGIYSQDANQRFITDCIFHGNSAGARGIYDEGNTDASIGSYISNSIFMGWTTAAIEIDKCDDFSIRDSTIDYNGAGDNILIKGQDGGAISGCYLGSNSDTKPALFIGDNAGATSSQNIRVVDNEFTGHPAAGNTYNNMEIESGSNAIIANNVFAFFTKYGIQYDTHALMEIYGNIFRDHPTLDSTGSIGCIAGDTNTVRIYNNILDADPAIAGNEIHGTTIAMLGSNQYYVTSALGVETMNNPDTSITVTHGMDITPDVVLITRNDMEGGANVNEYSAHTITATQFTISVDVTPAGGVDFYWRAWHSTRSMW